METKKIALTDELDSDSRRPFLILYRDINFGGAHFATKEGHDYYKLGSWNDRIHSFKLVGNSAVFRFYDDENFSGGNQHDAANDVRDVRSLGFPDFGISSFRLISWSGHSFD